MCINPYTVSTQCALIRGECWFHPHIHTPEPWLCACASPVCMSPGSAHLQGHFQILPAIA